MRTGGWGGGLREAGKVFRFVAYHGGHRCEGGEGDGKESTPVLAKRAVFLPQGLDPGEDIYGGECKGCLAPFRLARRHPCSNVLNA